MSASAPPASDPYRWDPEHQYHPVSASGTLNVFNTVEHKGALFVCKKECVGIPPNEDYTESEHWAPLALPRRKEVPA